MTAMDAEGQVCPDCAATYTLDDNYCRKCGMFVAALRQMTPADAHPTGREVIAARPGLPAPMRKAATALAIGTVLQIGVSVAGRMLANHAASSLASALTPRPKRAAARRREPARTVNPMQDADTISETLMIRRVWIRRG
jgi:ribosomal protein L40E